MEARPQTHQYQVQLYCELVIGTNNLLFLEQNQPVNLSLERGVQTNAPFSPSIHSHTKIGFFLDIFTLSAPDILERIFFLFDYSPFGNKFGHVNWNYRAAASEFLQCTVIRKKAKALFVQAA